jgi:hypothetical protein
VQPLCLAHENLAITPARKHFAPMVELPSDPDLRALLLPFDSLSLPERARALVVARRAGLAAADLTDPDRLEAGGLPFWCERLVAPAAAAGLIPAPQQEEWLRACASEGALRDPRVQAFLFGWHERALEILGGLLPDAEDGAAGTRARWFLGGVDTHPAG